jgi:hypothetical protein
MKILICLIIISCSLNNAKALGLVSSDIDLVEPLPPSSYAKAICICHETPFQAYSETFLYDEANTTFENIQKIQNSQCTKRFCGIYFED